MPTTPALSSPVPPDQTPARTFGEQRRRDIRHRAALRRELDRAVATADATFPPGSPIPF